MMIDVFVAAQFVGNMAEVITRMNPLASGAELLWHSDTRAVFETANHDRFVITGENLDWSNDGSLTGGAIDALTWRRGTLDLVTFATLQTTGDVLWGAFQAGVEGQDPHDLSEILTHHCWTYQGSELADLFRREDLGEAGAPGLGGNDRIYLNGGDDDFFTGQANDSLYGGTGDDVLSGGADDDVLNGGAGNDVLLGGTGDDVLVGWIGSDSLAGRNGADRLDGGFGQDVMDGGRGDDTLTGGAQADQFVFGPWSGQDVITDFAVGGDRLDIDWSGGIEVMAHGDDAVLVFGSNSVLLIGVAPADLALYSFT